MGANCSVRLRRVATAAATLVVAIVVALAVPVSQLRTVSIVTSCCCPDPAQCHCPDHTPDHSTQPTMRTCHRTSHEVVSPGVPAFVAPVLAIASAPVREVRASHAPVAEPHAAPSLPRPDGPS